MSLVRRIAREKRRLIVPLAVALIANLLAYLLVVRPLGVRSASAADRAAAAAAARRQAEQNERAARALVTGKARADEELATFYGQVLPPDLATARRQTYARLPALAREDNVSYAQRSSDVDQDEKHERFGRLRTRMVLEGDYEGLRQFIYDLETTPEFIIIDDVTLTQAEPGRPLTLTIELSTYYRRGADGV